MNAAPQFPPSLAGRQVPARGREGGCTCPPSLPGRRVPARGREGGSNDGSKVRIYASEVVFIGFAGTSDVRTCRVMGTPVVWRAKLAPPARLELTLPASEAGALSS